jgi:hypothetical protein
VPSLGNVHLALFTLALLALSIVGPLSDHLGTMTILRFGKSRQMFSTVLFLAMPQISRFRDAEKTPLE